MSFSLFEHLSVDSPLNSRSHCLVSSLCIELVKKNENQNFDLHILKIFNEVILYKF